MSTIDHAAIHREHQEAHRDHQSWIDDTSQWRRENAAALDVIAQVQDLVLRHEADVMVWGLECASHEQHILMHEHDIAQAEACGEHREVKQYELEHRRMQHQHEAAGQSHALLRRQHLSIMQQMQRLRDWLKITGHVTGHVDA